MSRIEEVAEHLHRFSASFILAGGTIKRAINVEVDPLMLGRLLKVIAPVLELLDYQIEVGQRDPNMNKDQLKAELKERQELNGVRNLIDIAQKGASRPCFHLEVRPEKVEPLLRAVGHGMVVLKESLGEAENVLTMNSLVVFVESFARGAKQCGYQIWNNNLQKVLFAKGDLVPMVERAIAHQQMQREAQA